MITSGMPRLPDPSILAQVKSSSLAFVFHTVPKMFGVIPRGAAQACAMAFSLIIFGYILLIGLIGGILEAGEVLVAPLKDP